MATSSGEAAPIGDTRGMRREEAEESGHEERGYHARTPVDVTADAADVRASGAGRRSLKVSAQQRGGMGRAGFRLRADGAWSAWLRQGTARAPARLEERWHTVQVAECGSHNRAALPLPSRQVS